MHFPVSGVDTPLWLPPLVALCISFFTSMGGVSGAFLLLPFQMSFLGYTAPSVSATNQVFNIVAIPSGVYRYIKEKRMLWPLAITTIVGTLPGVFVGAWIRVNHLPNPRHFKLFVGIVLLYIAVRLIQGILDRKERAPVKKEKELAEQGIRVASPYSLRRVEYRYAGEDHAYSPMGVLLLSLVVGVVGGIYGIGGGAIIAPFFVAIFKLPVHTVAGAALMGTCVTSVAGVLFFQFLAVFHPHLCVAPDWLLGFLFGVGGFFGMYLGARCQKHVPARAIKVLLCACLFFVAGKYMLAYF